MEEFEKKQRTSTVASHIANSEHPVKEYAYLKYLQLHVPYDGIGVHQDVVGINQSNSEVFGPGDLGIVFACWYSGTSVITVKRSSGWFGDVLMESHSVGSINTSANSTTWGRRLIGELLRRTISDSLLERLLIERGAFTKEDLDAEMMKIVISA